ncbi:MAG: hypothetical protein R3C12_05890 [Planctomycetaceae bacterium]
MTTPRGPMRLVLRGFVGGLAILQELHMLTEQANSYRVMWHVFQFANLKNSETEISVPDGLENKSFCIIAPKRFNRTSTGAWYRNDGRGQSWTVKDMLRIGSESARLHGIAKPKTRDEIEYGLFEAAKLQPFEVPRRES